ncbi:hypothetical protein QJS10_CPB17g01198 [Acorus calamus]|uniref:Uncharacterized protein n=1 Tax=Acorus calamus TaxID=4465 RepID=A0AAV9CSL3_ACOCL|nr:hypothetical protein QJS10_CPB17g01198 [Acorus calamus]
MMPMKVKMKMNMKKLMKLFMGKKTVPKVVVMMTSKISILKGSLVCQTMLYSSYFT